MIDKDDDTGTRLFSYFLPSRTEGINLVDKDGAGRIEPAQTMVKTSVVDPDLYWIRIQELP